MTENRRARRQRAETAIQVTDTLTGEVIGRVGNLSLDGMMLIANRPVREDALYQFAFELPDARHHPHTLEIGVHEQWNEPASAAGQYWAGFRFISISEADQATLGHWLERSARGPAG